MSVSSVSGPSRLIVLNLRSMGGLKKVLDLNLNQDSSNDKKRSRQTNGPRLARNHPLLGVGGLAFGGVKKQKLSAEDEQQQQQNDDGQQQHDCLMDHASHHSDGVDERQDFGGGGGKTLLQRLLSAAVDENLFGLNAAAAAEEEQQQQQSINFDHNQMIVDAQGDLPEITFQKSGSGLFGSPAPPAAKSNQLDVENETQLVDFDGGVFINQEVRDAIFDLAVGETVSYVD